LGRLGEVLISALNSASGETNTLGLPSRRSVCVILVDGLGSTNLKERSGSCEVPKLSTVRFGDVLVPSNNINFNNFIRNSL